MFRTRSTAIMCVLASAGLATSIHGQECQVYDTQAVRYTSSPGVNSNFGGPVAANGSVVFAGSFPHNSTASTAPAASGVYRLARDIDGQWSIVQTVVVNDPEVGNAFGWSIAIDGARAAIGAPADDESATNQGSVYIFEPSGDDWVQSAKLIASDGGSDYFGSSVDIEGDVVAIGAPFDADTAPNAGAVYVFRFDGVGWVQEQKLLASDGATFDLFGSTVATDGNRIAAAAPYTTTSDHGAVYIFEHDGKNWVQTQKIISASPPIFSQKFGVSLVLEASFLAIGTDVPNSPPGFVQTFVHDGSEWEFDEQLDAPDGDTNGNRFGRAIALSGPRMIVAAPRTDDVSYFLMPNEPPTADSGAAYVFELVGDRWLFRHMLVKDWNAMTFPNPATLDFMGSSVAVAEGDVLLASPFVTNDSTPNHGVFVFPLEPPDCDGDGIADACGPDCNGNRVPDGCEIAQEISGDCNANSVPDECDAGYDYQLDMGFGSFPWGGPKQTLPEGADFIWLNHFEVAAGQEIITHIAVPWTCFATEGLPVTLALWNDPNNDGDPHDATLLATTTATTIDDFGNNIAMRMSIYPIAPTFVGSWGEGFFVGAAASLPPGGAPAVFDQGRSVNQSWFAFEPTGTADIDSLGNNDSLAFIDGFDFVIRAIAIDCNGNSDWDECDLASGTSLDANRNGVPDECEATCVADVIASGTVDVDDLLAVINAWGACEAPDKCPADIAPLGGNDVVDVDDLLTVINAWGLCPR